MADRVGDESVYLRLSDLKKGKVQFTDATNAERFVREHGDNIRYLPAWKKWLVWNGTHWQTDESGALIHGKGLLTVRNIYDELLKTDDYRERIEIEKFGMMSESVRRRKAFIEAASWIEDYNIQSEELDANPWLLNVKNGTIDMKEGMFREHRQSDFITKLANVDFNKKADCPLWKQFIREIMDYKSTPLRKVKFVQAFF